MEINIAYGTVPCNQGEHIYDNALQLDSKSTNEIIDNSSSNTKTKTSYCCSRGTTIVASFALALALVSLLAAAVAVYLGTHGTGLANTSSQSNLQSISILQQAGKTLQIELNNTRNDIAILQVEVRDSKNEIALLKAELNDSITEIVNIQNQMNLLNENSGVQNAIITALTAWTPRSVGSFWNPVRTCEEIVQESPFGYYWIQTNGTVSPVQVYCEINRTSCSCNTTGGWMRVANLDMTDPNKNCPARFRLITRASAPLRMCGRPGPAGCVSTTFQTYGVEYFHVCGRVTGYQLRTPDAFGQDKLRGTTIDTIYVDGVSLTHGRSPRQHIWTFVGAHDEIGEYGHNICPCTQSEIPYTGTIPSFVGQDYFCDTGSREAWSHTFYPNDPLWDGQGCEGNSTCCEFNNPPWFCRQLPQPTTDDIELRLCGDEPTDNEDILLELVEIYVH